MALFDTLFANVRKIVLMEHKIDSMIERVDRLAGFAEDHEKRLIRIETLVEVAQGRSGPPRLRGD